MSAPIRDRRTTRALTALTLTALLILPSMAVLQPVSAQVQLHQIYLNPGTATVSQAGIKTWFIDGNVSDDPLVKVTVWNNGATEAPANIPVYVWDWEHDFPTTCVTFPKIPPSSSENPNGGSWTKDIQISRPKWMEGETVNPKATKGSYNFTILVNRHPTHLPANQRCGTLALGNSNLDTGDLAPTADRDASDNIAFFGLVKDRRPDLYVDAIRWCRGKSPNEGGSPGGCLSSETDFKTSANGATAWYNTTRRWNDTEDDPNNPDPNGARLGVLNDTWFEVEVRNDITHNLEQTGPWGDLINIGSLGCDLTEPTSLQPDNWDRNVSRETCDEYGYELQVKIAKLPESGATGALVNGTSLVGYGDGNFATDSFRLLNASGHYEVWAAIEPRGLANTFGLRERSTAAGDAETKGNEATRLVEVRYSDLYPEFDLNDFKTSVADKYPYPVGGTIRIEGDLRIQNDGTDRPLNFTNLADPLTAEHANVTVRVTIDNKTDAFTRFYSREDLKHNATNAEAPWLIRINYLATTTDGSSYLSPGDHRLCAQVDYYNWTMEPNKANNTACIVIYLEDKTKPVIEEIMGEKKPRIVPIGAGPYSEPLTKVRPKEPFFVHMNASDDAQSSLNVSLNFTLASNQSITRFVYPCAPGTPPASAVNCVRASTTSTVAYSALLNDFKFATNASREVWEVRTIARDAFDNNETSPATALTLDRWPIFTMNDSLIVLGIQKPSEPGQVEDVYFEDGHEFNWSQPGVPLQYKIYVEKNWTGITAPPDQYNWTTGAVGCRGRNYNPDPLVQDDNEPICTPNFAFTLTLPGDPENPKYYGAGNWTSQINACDNPQTQLPQPCQDVGEFIAGELSFLRSREGAGKPGRWNFTIEITDFGGDVRKINRSFILKDQAPTLRLPVVAPTVVNATENISVEINASDDFVVNRTFVNFTRKADNTTVSIEFIEPWAKVNESGTADGGRSYHWRANITTGHRPDSLLGNAGEYDVRFAAEDLFGNWANLTAGTINILDPQAPVLLDAKPNVTSAEVGADVLFTANATDASNITAYLQVLKGSEELFPRINMTEEPLGSGNFSYVVNFTEEGNFVWNIWVVDSKGQQSTLKTGPISISDNLGPNADVRQPSVSVNGQLYAKAAPQIGILLQDRHGVDAGTIELYVGGVQIPDADLVKQQLDEEGKAWVVNYTVPADEKFNHRETVDVNVSAFDLSPLRLFRQHNFTFIVDDSPPTTTLVQPFSPRFRADDRNVWNVSLSTQFTLTANDNDGLPHAPPTIRYSIIGGSNNEAQAVYSGPFTIGGAPTGIYTGPRIYQIRYWSEDDVGNANRSESITVYVDDIPPSLDPFGSLPQGRFINATFLDDRSGVDRAVVWVSFNGQPFQPTSLDFSSGLWSTILAEGKRGDRVAYYLQAWDRVNNTETFGNSTEPYASYLVGNHVPKIKITNPATGSTISRIVDMTWDASDEDADTLSYTVYFRAPGRTSFAEIAKIEVPTNTKYSLDTNRFTDGEYTFRVTASDGSFVSASETTVTIRNRNASIGAISPLPGEVQPGDPILIKAQITKANAAVEARIFRDGKFVQAYPMNDEGRDGDEVANDGVYSVRVAFETAGQYSVEIYTRYQEDGQLKESSLPGAGSFAVALTPKAIVATYGGLIALIALLAIAGVAVAAFVLTRRR